MNLTFGEQVKIVLSRKGMTIKELAAHIEERTGKKMSRQNLTQRLGRDNFQEQDMRMIASILGCPFYLTILEDGIPAETNTNTKVAATPQETEQKNTLEITEKTEAVSVQQQNTEKKQVEPKRNRTRNTKASKKAEKIVQLPEETFVQQELVFDMSFYTDTEEVAEEEAAPAYEEAAQEEAAPTYEEPAQEEPAPVSEEAAQEESAPVYEEPVQEEEEPVYEESAYEEPVYEEAAPIYEEPVYEEVASAYEEPTYEEPVYEEIAPAYEEATYEEPIYEEASYEEPVYEKPEYEDSITLEEVLEAQAPVEEILQEMQAIEEESIEREQEKEKKEEHKEGGFRGWRAYLQRRKKKEEGKHEEIENSAQETQVQEVVQEAKETEEPNYEVPTQEELTQEKLTYEEPAYEESTYEEPMYEEPVGEINPYTNREYETNSVRVHPKRIGYVQVYDREEHKWNEMTEWAFLGYQEQKKALLGDDYEEPIYLD